MSNGHLSSEASSSSHSPQEQSIGSNHHYHENPGANDPARTSTDDDNNLLGEDPLHGDLDESISFKRKQKRPSIFSLAQQTRLFTNFTGPRRESSTRNNTPDIPIPPAIGDVPGHGAENPEDVGASPPRRRMGSIFTGSKNGTPLDWYVEGPGRRVGYEDLTAIDWIFEYTKERTRLRVLRSNSRGILGYFQLAFDNCQEWIILLSTGIMVGTVAAVIDIVTDWLGDLKAGYCTTTEGGTFYLNKSFCCLGYDEGAQCMGWRPWATALGVSSAAGKWIIEYFLFIIFSVRPPLPPKANLGSNV